MTLQGIFAGRSRLDRIGLFLALLELAREQRVRVRQDRAEDAIEIELRDAPIASAPSAATMSAS
jgi:chromatin segregation and condensation protein Rec8/ScpA/Scc1 (kleisin family)